MNSIVITGCNRGIGLGLIKNLVKDTNSPKNIIATCRSREKAKELTELSSAHNNLHVLELDLKNIDSFEPFSKLVKDIVQEEGLNVLVNNAAYAPKSTRINFVKSEQMIESFATNVVGPLLLTKNLLPLLKNASKKNANQPFGCSKAAIINMSSVYGSIASNFDGGLYPYKSSKAALNMITKSLSIDLKGDGIMVTSVHPGWVKTDMGGSNAPLSVEESVSGILNLIKKLNNKHNGGFYQWDGKELPW